MWINSPGRISPDAFTQPAAYRNPGILMSRLVEADDYSLQFNTPRDLGESHSPFGFV